MFGLETHESILGFFVEKKRFLDAKKKFFTNKDIRDLEQKYRPLIPELL